MKKTKFLLGALSLTALTPALPMVMTSCNKKSEDNSFSPTINKDGTVTDVSVSKTELNRAFSVACTCADGYEVDSSKTLVQVGNSTLTLDTDYIVYKDVIIVGSAAVTNKSVTVNIATKPVAMYYTVSLYANEGTFSGASSKVINNVKKGTALKDIDGYVEPTKTNETFAYWLDANGNKYTKDSKVTSNVMLGAYYEEKPGTPTNLQTDNWATVAKACACAVDFANAYIKDKTYTEAAEEDAINAIKNKIDIYAKNYKETEKPAGYLDLSKTMEINLGGWYVNVTVRLIDVGKDKAVEKNKDVDTLFTWEFKDIIDICNYNYEGNSIWYQENEEGEILHSCLLRGNCNDVLFESILPASVKSNIVEVWKETKTEHTGAIVKSKEKVFPLSYGEIGLQAANTVVNDLRTQGQYQFYYSLVGKSNQEVVTKHYLGYDGTKEYEGEYPAIAYQMWTRSPNNASTIWKYNPDNGKLSAEYSNAGYGVAPAFCF